MKITLDLLNNMPSGAVACDDGQEWFAENYPDGVDLRDLWDAIPRNDWKVWLALNLLPRSVVEELAFKFAGQAFGYAAILNPELSRYAGNVTRENVNDAVDAARAADAAYDADAAAYAARAARAAYAAADATARAAADAAYAAATTVLAQWCEEELRLAGYLPEK